jgi:tetratricopeptide (TPR) repeat protein
VKLVNGFDDLERKLDQLLKEPNNSQLFNDIGVLLCQVKDLENAEIYLQKAYELNPSSKDILYNYATLLYLKLKWWEAISIYQAYSELDPNDTEVIEKIGDSYYQLCEYELAAKIYEKLKKLRKETT